MTNPIENAEVSNETVSFDHETYKGFAVAMKSATTTFSNKSVLWARASLVAMNNGDIDDLGVAKALYAAYKPMSHGKLAKATRSKNGVVSVAALRRVDAAGSSLVKNFEAVVTIHNAIGVFDAEIDKAIWAFITGEKGASGLYSLRDIIAKAYDDKAKADIGEEGEEGEAPVLTIEGDASQASVIAAMQAYIAGLDMADIDSETADAIADLAGAVVKQATAYSDHVASLDVALAA